MFPLWLPSTIPWLSRATGQLDMSILVSFRNYFMDTPVAQKDKTMHSAILLYAHFYIKVFIMLNIHAHAGFRGFKIHAPGSQNFVHCLDMGQGLFPKVVKEIEDILATKR